jgi:D-alanyl-lipoteichoic acid acyltransferase DltB (MBOAT superfamily)
MMIFHSLDFIVFFVVTLVVYWHLPHRGQNAFLVLASYFFYGYVHPWFLVLIFATTVLDYWAARGMAALPERKALFLGLSLAGNLGMLAFFKYFNFFADNVHALLTPLGLSVPTVVLRIALPVGVSFYTFQELSYTIDVYRGTLSARRDFLNFAAFVCFFPQLVAGPIERASRLLPQMEQPRVFSWETARQATWLMTWGYFQKLVIADNVGVVANKVFALAQPSFELLWAGVFAFAIQIYADFSAYSDIARGAARWLGVDVVRNFNHPYLAVGPADFWRRWHVSLSSWFRDYVYIPLGGSRGGRGRTAGNVMITFLLSGLWHGASWNYVVWGGYHGTLLLAGRAVDTLMGPGPRSRILTPVRVLLTFVLVLVGWLMFRETDIVFLWHDLHLSPMSSTGVERRAGLYLFLLACVYALPLWIHDLWAEHRRSHADRDDWGWQTGREIAWETAWCAVLVCVMLVLRSRTSLDFIYFQF